MASQIESISIFTPMIIRIITIFIAFLTWTNAVNADSDSVTVSLKGKAYDTQNPDLRLEDLMIINLRTSQGTFGKVDGTFEVNLLKADTLLIASTGYEYQKITLTDSAYHQNYFMNIPMVKLNRQLKEVVIFSPRDLQAIYTDIEKLGYNKKDFELSGVDAFSSPITFLYQQFSPLERAKRHNAQLRNEDKRRALLKQLLVNYVAHDIINLNDDEFEDFISFSNVSESYLKRASQYDFCIYIKQKFDVYRMMKANRR